MKGITLTTKYDKEDQEQRDHDEAMILHLMDKYRISRKFAENAVQDSKTGVNKDPEVGIRAILERRRDIAEAQKKVLRTGEKLGSEGGRGYWFATDRKLKLVALAVAVFMMISWTAQWVAYALPYWKGDAHHVAGLFQCCGDTDLIFNTNTTMVEPGVLYPWRCENVEDYADRFIAMFDQFSNDPAARYQQAEARDAKPLIIVSRYLEALSTLADMYFGLFSIYLIVYPKLDDRINGRNWYIAAIGVSLAPALCLIDSVLTFNNFKKLGVGALSNNIQTFFYGSGDTVWVGTGLDVVLQYAFLFWASAYQFKISKAIRLKEEAEFEAAAAIAAAATSTVTTTTATSTVAMVAASPAEVPTELREETKREDKV